LEKLFRFENIKQLTTYISIPWFTPAYLAGGPIQSVFTMVNNCDEMDFKIITSNLDINNVPLKNIPINQWVVFNKQTKVYYGDKQLSLFKHIHLIKSVKANAVFIIGIYSFRFTILPILFSSSANIILSARGMLHPPALRQKAFKKKLYLALLKPILKWKNVSFHATDETEKSHIQSVIGNQAKVRVAQNIPNIRKSNVSYKSEGTINLLTVALIGPMKNHLQILKALKDCKHNVQYDICGHIYFPEYWNECLKIIQQLPSNIKVFHHGPIPPNELDSFYTNAHVFICPSQSENFGHALFEGLSAGKPLITSNNTPWNDLEKNNAGLNVEPIPEQLKNAIDFFAKINDTDYNKWSISAKDYSNNTVDIVEIKKAYYQMFHHHEG
jgi:glycosyltransferase involved in cell wall biosynthesis